MKREVLTLACAMIAIIAGGGAPGDAQAEIGVLAAVNRDMTGARPSEAARPIFIKERLVADERIETSADGGGQVLFLDQTSLTIAPNSSVVLDKYVYDPDSQTGEIGVSVVRGALRLVGGRITKTSAATIKTPSATIGIRGGISNTVIGEDGNVLHFHLAGISSTISSGSDTLTITREGGYASVGPDGGVEYLGIATADILNAALTAGAGRGDGGSIAGAQAGGGANAVSSVVSGADAAIESGPISTSGERQTVAFGASALPTPEAPDDEFADATLMSDETIQMSEGPTQFLDGVVFFGDHQVAVETDNGVTNGIGEFQLLYSIQQGEGTVIFQIPNANDFFVPSVDENGVEIATDGFVVVEGGSSIIAEPGLGTLAQGNPNASLSISGSLLNGQYSVDYRNSSLIVNTLQVTGQVADLPGIDVPPDADIPALTQSFRDSLAASGP